MWKTLTNELHSNELRVPSGPRTPTSRPTTPSHVDQVLKRAASKLHPYLKAIAAFTSTREFEARPSHYRLSVAVTGPTKVAPTVSVTLWSWM
jgi:hypothetical protein